MFLFGIGIVFLMALVAVLSRLRYGDPLYPPVMQAGVWATVLLVYLLSGSTFDQVSYGALAVFGAGVLMFAAGAYAATWNFRPPHAEDDPLRGATMTRTRLLDLLFWANLFGLPLAVYEAWELARQGPTESLLINLRIQETLTDPNAAHLWNYMVLLAVVSAGLHLLSEVSRLRVAAAIATAAGYALLTTGRTWMLLLTLFLLGVAVMTGRVTARRAMAGGIAASALVFFAVALALGKGGRTGQPLDENLGGLGRALQVYVAGPLPAFDRFLHNAPPPARGEHMLRSVWAATERLGFDTRPAPLVQEFVEVPYPTNVYTLYRPYIEDLGLAGALAAPLLLGSLHGVLYRRARSGSLLFVCLYALSLYPLVMQFFQDQYFSLLSQWLQMLAVVGVWFYLTPRNRFL